MSRRERFRIRRSYWMKGSLSIFSGRGKTSGRLVDNIFMRPKSKKDKRASVQSIYEEPNSKYLRISRPKRRKK